MEQALKTIKSVSFWFFIVIVGAYTVSSLLVLQNLGIPLTKTLTDMLLLPSAVIAIAYGTTALLVNASEEKSLSRFVTIGIISAGVILTIVVVFAHFLLPIAATP